MISVLDVLTHEKFKSWIADNESMLALIARQGGSEDLLRSIIGAWFQLNKPELTFVSERYDVDLIICSDNESLVCEFKHNFIGQGEREIKNNFISAVKQVMRGNTNIPYKKNYREVILLLVQIFSVESHLPEWAKKYSNNVVTIIDKCNSVIEKVKEFKDSVDGQGFELSPGGHVVFDLSAKGVVEIKLHAFVYQACREKSEIIE